jgi:hypothetical protein
MPIRKALLLGLAFALSMLALERPAYACCRPCGSWCLTTTPTTPCCTGIPEPGNACGLTTCGKWLSAS